MNGKTRFHESDMSGKTQLENLEVLPKQVILCAYIKLQTNQQNPNIWRYVSGTDLIRSTCSSKPDQDDPLVLGTFHIYVCSKSHLYYRGSI